MRLIFLAIIAVQAAFASAMRSRRQIAGWRPGPRRKLGPPTSDADGDFRRRTRQARP